jgi:transcriptional regulator with XRE-family HTH domain
MQSSNDAVKTIGKNVRLFRKIADISGLELALRAGVAPSTVSKIEHSRIKASIGVLAAIAKVLNVPVGDLMKDNQSIAGFCMHCGARLSSDHPNRQHRN